jgi:tRNA-2-methylthio-N6-dimethylallyladenosine synthase
MHRGYNKERFIQKIDMIKSIIPDVSLTTDIIVGFPGETDEDFSDTMDIVNYAEFDSIYMFQFSPRPGTAAYDMEEDFVNKEMITKRFQYLKDKQTDISYRRLKRFIGTSQTVLIENTSKKNDNIFTGKINSGQITHIDKTGVSVGDLVNVNIVDSTPFYLKAEKI